jgi:hypothetical protein
MKKVIVGVDFSLNSCAITIHHKGISEFMSFYSFFNRYELSVAKVFNKEAILKLNPIVAELESVVNFVFLERLPASMPKKTKESKWNDLSLWNQKHINDIEVLTKSIISKLEEELNEYESNEIFFAIENYDLGTMKDSTATIPLIEFTGRFKSKVINELKVDINNFHVVSAPEVKMLAGKGNFLKYDMYKAFKNNVLGDVDLTKTELYRYVQRKKESDLTKERKKKDKDGKPIYDMIKPLDDLFDSYFICRWLDLKLNS